MAIGKKINTSLSTSVKESKPQKLTTDTLYKYLQMMGGEPVIVKPDGGQAIKGKFAFGQDVGLNNEFTKLPEIHVRFDDPKISSLVAKELATGELTVGMQRNPQTGEIETTTKKFKPIPSRGNTQMRGYRLGNDPTGDYLAFNKPEEAYKAPKSLKEFQADIRKSYQTFGLKPDATIADLEAAVMPIMTEAKNSPELRDRLQTVLSDMQNRNIPIEPPDPIPVQQSKPSKTQLGLESDRIGGYQPKHVPQILEALNDEDTYRAVLGSMSIADQERFNSGLEAVQEGNKFGNRDILDTLNRARRDVPRLGGDMYANDARQAFSQLDDSLGVKFGFNKTLKFGLNQFARSGNQTSYRVDIPDQAKIELVRAKIDGVDAFKVANIVAYNPEAVGDRFAMKTFKFLQENLPKPVVMGNVINEKFARIFEKQGYTRRGNDFLPPNFPVKEKLDLSGFVPEQTLDTPSDAWKFPQQNERKLPNFYPQMASGDNPLGTGATVQSTYDRAKSAYEGYQGFGYAPSDRKFPTLREMVKLAESEGVKGDEAIKSYIKGKQNAPLIDAGVITPPELPLTARLGQEYISPKSGKVGTVESVGKKGVKLNVDGQVVPIEYQTLEKLKYAGNKGYGITSNKAMDLPAKFVKGFAMREGARLLAKELGADEQQQQAVADTVTAANILGSVYQNVTKKSGVFSQEAIAPQASQNLDMARKSVTGKISLAETQKRIATYADSDLRSGDMRSYADINASLRGDNPLGDARSAIAIQDYLQKAPSFESGSMVYRGIKAINKPVEQALADLGISQGGEYFDKGFQSYSKDRFVAEGFAPESMGDRIILQSKSRAGVELGSLGLAGEKEVLLPAGLRQRVESIEIKSNDFGGNRTAYVTLDDVPESKDFYSKLDLQRKALEFNKKYDSGEIAKQSFSNKRVPIQRLSFEESAANMGMSPDEYRKFQEDAYKAFPQKTESPSGSSKPPKYVEPSRFAVDAKTGDRYDMQSFREANTEWRRSTDEATKPLREAYDQAIKSGDKELQKAAIEAMDEVKANLPPAPVKAAFLAPLDKPVKASDRKIFDMGAMSEAAMDARRSSRVQGEAPMTSYQRKFGILDQATGQIVKPKSGFQQLVDNVTESLFQPKKSSGGFGKTQPKPSNFIDETAVETAAKSSGATTSQVKAAIANQRASGLAPDLSKATESVQQSKSLTELQPQTKALSTRVLSRQQPDSMIATPSQSMINAGLKDQNRIKIGDRLGASGLGIFMDTAQAANVLTESASRGENTQTALTRAGASAGAGYVTTGLASFIPNPYLRTAAQIGGGIAAVVGADKAIDLAVGRNEAKEQKFAKDLSKLDLQTTNEKEQWKPFANDSNIAAAFGNSFTAQIQSNLDYRPAARSLANLTNSQAIANARLASERDTSIKSGMDAKSNRSIAYEDRGNGVTVAYGRYRGYTSTESRVLALQNLANESGYEVPRTGKFESKTLDALEKLGYSQSQITEYIQGKTQNIGKPRQAEKAGSAVRQVLNRNTEKVTGQQLSQALSAERKALGLKGGEMLNQGQVDQVFSSLAGRSLTQLRQSAKIGGNKTQSALRLGAGIK